MNKKIFILTTLFLLSLFLTFSFVYSATTISLFGPPPTEKEIEFIPNLHKELDFEVVSPAKSIRTYVEAPEQIKDYIKLVDDAQFTGSRSFKVILDLPSYLPPGKYSFFVGAITSKANSPDSEGLGVNTAVQLRFDIIVYHDEKVISAEMFPKDTVLGGKAEVLVKVRSWSKQDIRSVYSKLYVKSPEGTIYGPFVSNALSLPAKKTINLTVVIDTAQLNLSKGTYEVFGEVHYDDLVYQIPENKSFRVGDLNLILKNYDRFLRPGVYNKVNFYVLNEWNEIAKNVYLEMDFNGEILKSVPKDIRPFSTQTFEIFIDGTNMKVGDVFNAPLKIVYGEKTWSYNITLRVEEAPKNEEEVPKTQQNILLSPLVLVVIIFMILLLIMNITIFFMLIKKESKKDEKEH